MAHMVTIDNLTESKKLVKIELDTGEKLAIPLSVAAQYCLKKGKMIESDEYRQLKSESERQFCTQKALDYLLIKNRTSTEIRKHLTKKGFSVDIIREVIFQLEERGLIDDFKYAVSYTRSRRATKIVGNRLIKSELQHKGLPRGIIRKAIEKAIEESGCSEPCIEDVLSLAREKYNGVRGKKNAYHKLSDFLVRRGFDFEIIRQVVEQLQNEEGGKKE